MPIIFGAVHPFTQGLYTFAIISLAGGGLLFCRDGIIESTINFRVLSVPFILFLYIVISSLPVPLFLISIFSPHRARALMEVNILTDSDINLASLSYNGLSGLPMAAFYLALILFFIVMVSSMKKRKDLFYTICIVMVATGSFEAVYGLLQVLFPHLGILWLPNITHCACGSIIYKNQYAAFLNLCWPTALALYIDCANKAKQVRKTKGKRRYPARFIKDIYFHDNKGLLFLFLAVVMMLAILFSLSRAGILVMFLIWALLFLLLPFPRKKTLLLFSAVFAGLLFYGSQIGFHKLLERFLTLEKSGISRITVWISSLPILYDYWLTGIGIGSYKLLSSVYLKHFPPDIIWDRAHNEYLETVLELGVPAAGLLFGWIFSRLSNAYHYFLNQRHGDFSAMSLETFLAVSSLASITGLLFHGLVDFVWKLPANALFCTTLAALLYYCMQEISGQHLSYHVPG